LGEATFALDLSWIQTGNPSRWNEVNVTTGRPMTGDTDIVYRELNTRWLRLFSTVTPFTGQACSFTALIGQRDACLRAKSILEAYDQFEAPFPETPTLRKVIAKFRKEIPAFLEAFPTAILRLSEVCWLRFRCICHYGVRICQDPRFSKSSTQSCFRKLEMYVNEYRQWMVLSEQHGLTLIHRVAIMNESICRFRNI